MNMCRCPHCGEEGITALRKCNLGPAIPATCQRCGKKVAVSWWSVVMAIPMIAGFTVAPALIQSPVLIAFAATLLTTISFCLSESLVPLIRK